MLLINMMFIFIIGMTHYSSNILHGTKSITIDTQLLLYHHLNTRGLTLNTGVVICCDTLKGYHTIQLLINRWKGKQIMIIIEKVDFYLTPDIINDYYKVINSDFNNNNYCRRTKNKDDNNHSSKNSDNNISYMRSKKSNSDRRRSSENNVVDDDECHNIHQKRLYATRLLVSEFEKSCFDVKMMKHNINCIIMTNISMNQNPYIVQHLPTSFDHHNYHHHHHASDRKQSDDKYKYYDDNHKYYHDNNDNKFNSWKLNHVIAMTLPSVFKMDFIYIDVINNYDNYFYSIQLWMKVLLKGGLMIGSQSMSNNQLLGQLLHGHTRRDHYHKQHLHYHSHHRNTYYPHQHHIDNKMTIFINTKLHHRHYHHSKIQSSSSSQLDKHPFLMNVRKYKSINQHHITEALLHFRYQINQNILYTHAEKDSQFCSDYIHPYLLATTFIVNDHDGDDTNNDDDVKRFSLSDIMSIECSPAWYLYKQYTTW